MSLALLILILVAGALVLVAWPERRRGETCHMPSITRTQALHGLVGTEEELNAWLQKQREGNGDKPSKREWLSWILRVILTGEV
jgi:hypothetical protein